jgi:hypothetical protein
MLRTFWHGRRPAHPLAHSLYSRVPSRKHRRVPHPGAKQYENSRNTLFFTADSDPSYRGYRAADAVSRRRSVGTRPEGPCSRHCGSFRSTDTLVPEVRVDRRSGHQRVILKGVLTELVASAKWLRADVADARKIIHLQDLPAIGRTTGSTSASTHSDGVTPPLLPGRHAIPARRQRGTTAARIR